MRVRVLNEPPAAIHRAKLDNLALLPGHLLEPKEAWRDLAASLPNGSLLIVLIDPSDSALVRTLGKIEVQTRHPESVERAVARASPKKGS